MRSQWAVEDAEMVAELAQMEADQADELALIDSTLSMDEATAKTAQNTPATEEA